MSKHGWNGPASGRKIEIVGYRIKCIHILIDVKIDVICHQWKAELELEKFEIV